MCVPILCIHLYSIMFSDHEPAVFGESCDEIYREGFRFGSDSGDVLVWDHNKGRDIIEPKPYLTFLIRNSRLVKNILNIARSLNLISRLFHDGFIRTFDYYIKEFYVSWIENDLPAPALL